MPQFVDWVFSKQNLHILLLLLCSFPFIRNLKENNFQEQSS
jgi:hypothetical protein